MTHHPHLFDAGEPERRRGSKVLVPVDRTECPDCGGELDSETVTEAPLLRHGGYGAARETVRLHCRCGWSLVPSVSEVRP